MKTLILMGMIAMAGCSKGHGHPAVDCATAVGAYVDGPVQQAYLKPFADAPAPEAAAGKKIWAAQAPGWKDAMTKRCTEDRWTQKAISCVYTTQDPAATNCELTDAQRTALKNMP